MFIIVKDLLKISDKWKNMISGILFSIFDEIPSKPVLFFDFEDITISFTSFGSVGQKYIDRLVGDRGK